VRVVAVRLKKWMTPQTRTRRKLKTGKLLHQQKREIFIAFRGKPPGNTKSTRYTTTHRDPYDCEALSLQRFKAHDMHYKPTQQLGACFTRPAGQGRLTAVTADGAKRVDFKATAKSTSRYGTTSKKMEGKDIQRMLRLLLCPAIPKAF
jgi:hypothetical protein